MLAWLRELYQGCILLSSNPAQI